MSEQDTNEVEQQQETAVEETTEAQSTDKELGDAGKKALDAERSARKESDKQAKAALARVAEIEAELEKARAAAEEATKAKAEMEHRDLVREIAAEYELPDGIQKFLTGADRDELEANAKELKGIVDQMLAPRRPQPVPEAGRGTDARRSTADQFAKTVESLFG